MSNKPWTDGPWGVEPIGGGAGFGINGADGTAVVWWASKREPKNGIRLEEDANLIAAAPGLVEALEFYTSRAKQPGEDDIDHYERLAQEFKRKTGMMAPGKDAPPELEINRDHVAEREAWREFLSEPLENARKVLRKAYGEDQG